MPQQTWDIADLPDEVASKVAELGEPLADFHACGPRLALRMLTAPLAFLVGMGLVSLPLFALAWHGRGGPLLFKLAVVGLILIPGAVVRSIRTLRNWGLRVLVYPEGMVRLHGSQVDAFLWDELTTVWKKKSQGIWAKLAQGSLVYSVRRAGGQEYTFDDHLPDVARLGELIEHATLTCQLPPALEALAAGERLDFQKVRLSRKGLHGDGDTLRWSEVKEVKAEDAVITVSKQGKWRPWLQAPVGDMPNPHLFLALVRHAQGGVAAATGG